MNRSLAIAALSGMTLLSPFVLQAQDLFSMPKGARSRVSSFENLNGRSGAGGLTNHGAKGNAFESLKAGESKTLLDVHTAGIIQRMWFTVGDRSFPMLRSLRLRIYWDGSAKPAVDVPFGDFFCAGLKPVAFQSSLFSNPEGRSFNCYIPMPFRSGARLVLTNESRTDLALLFFDIDFLELDHPAVDMLYFHASWRREIRSAPEKDFEILSLVRGKGRLLGVSVGVNVDSIYKSSWWGEGEVKLYIDGDRANPTINGTGAEDYIGTGWGEGTFAHLYQGCLLADGKTGQYSFYRWHVPDAIYFYQDLRATIQKIGGASDPDLRLIQERGALLKPISVSGEKDFTRLLDDLHAPALRDPSFPKGWTNFYRVDDYSATAYFYLDKPSNDLPGLAAVEERVR